MISPELDLKYMSQAVQLSRKSCSEDDGRIHPYVGAVVVSSNGEIISEGYRGMHTPGHHAEQEALIQIPDDVLAGSTVYSTVEPCTFRGHQMPCCQRLIDRHVGEVVIGILDPNRDIRGQGWWKFEERGIKVRNFEFNLVKEIRELNRTFIDYQLGLGVMITTVKPQDGQDITVTSNHRKQQTTVPIPASDETKWYTVSGSYRVRPLGGDRISAFLRRGSSYYLQSPINWSPDTDDADGRRWECKVAVRTSASDPLAEIIIARLSDDLYILAQHYGNVHTQTKKWVGVQMSNVPPGFEHLARITLERKTQ